MGVGEHEAGGRGAAREARVRVSRGRRSPQRVAPSWKMVPTREKARPSSPSGKPLGSTTRGSGRPVSVGKAPDPITH